MYLCKGKPYNRFNNAHICLVFVAAYYSMDGLFQRYVKNNKVSIHNLSDNFYPSDELQYINYLKLILSRQDQPTNQSYSLRKVELRNKYSLGNAINKIAIVFIPREQNNLEDRIIDIEGKLFQQLVFETPQLFIVTSLPSRQKEILNKLIEVYEKERKGVHVIRGKDAQLIKLAKILSIEQKQSSIQTRRLIEELYPIQ